MTVTAKHGIYKSQVEGIPDMVFDENKNTLTIGDHTFDNGYMILHHIFHLRSVVITNRAGILSR